jgi:hypothetical protein
LSQNFTQAGIWAILSMLFRMRAPGTMRRLLHLLLRQCKMQDSMGFEFQV